MDYDESLEWLNSHEKMGIRLGLENTTDLLAALGDPQKTFRSVHVAGTNGKGSVCAMISSVLREEGYRVGLYTSPHLVDFRERIQVNEKMGIRLGLENTANLLAALGDPQKTFRSVHVAGTNGKGSICAMISSVLREEGYRVGLYTSPHLVDFRERIQVNGKMIAPDEMALIATQIRKECERLLQESPERMFTFFEITTALSFSHFSRQGVEEAVVEVGMGGRLDSTNVIIPDCSVISSISLEHTQYLGRTLPEIAWEKAGIIKPNVPVVVVDQAPEILEVFERVAREKKSSLEVVGKGNSDYRLISSTLEGTQVEVQGMEGGLFVPLAGSYQAQNVALACSALMQLMKRGVFLSDNAIRRGLEKVAWPGRLQVVSRSPLLVLDATHTPDGAKVVSKEIERLVGKKIILVIGVLDDKDLEGMCQYFGPLAKIAFATAPNTKRAFPAETVASHLERYSDQLRISNSVSEALQAALDISTPNDAVVVTGSLYTLGEAKGWLDERKADQ